MHIPYREEDPYLDTEAELIESARISRRNHIDALLRSMQRSVSDPKTDLVFVTGDFNEPLPYDWTDANTIAGVRERTSVVDRFHTHFFALKKVTSASC